MPPPRDAGKWTAWMLRKYKQGALAHILRSRNTPGSASTKLLLF